MLKPYDRYKETNIPWLTKIPSHWSLLRNKNVLFEQKELVDDNATDYTLLSLTLNGVIARNMESGKGKFPKEFNAYKIVNKHNIIFCLFDIDETPRTVGLSKLEGMITGAYDVFEVTRINRAYLYYYYLSVDNAKDMKPLYTGLRKVIGVPRFLGTKLPVPPREEQDQIVKYLDWQNSKINILIKAKKKQIELLKEQKQAVINKAVTKGLDDTVPMKDSGIEWLGEVPEHWTIRKLRTLTKCQFQYGANESGVPYLDTETRYIRITDIDMQGNLKNGGKMSLLNKIAKQYLLEDGDILFARSGATVGKSFIFKQEYGKSAFAGYLIRFKPNQEIVFPSFVYNFTLGSGYNLWISHIFIQATIQNISAEKYKNLQIALPPLDEQQTIVTCLEEKTALIDNAIAIIEKEIELVSEYKTSLISSVVTGKVDVRDVVVPEFQVLEEIVENTEDDEGLEVDTDDSN